MKTIKTIATTAALVAILFGQIASHQIQMHKLEVVRLEAEDASEVSRQCAEWVIPANVPDEILSIARYELAGGDMSLLDAHELCAYDAFMEANPGIARCLRVR